MRISDWSSDVCSSDLGGQPTPAHLAELVREGVHTVINLRAPEEPTEYDEAAEAARLGLHYVSLPIAGAADLDRARVREFGQKLDDARREGGVLIHCGSSNRVGAMIARSEEHTSELQSLMRISYAVFCLK